METRETPEENESLLMKVSEHKKPTLSFPVEVILHGGSIMIAVGVIMIAAVENPENVDTTYALTAVCTYYGGSLLVTMGGFIAVLHARHHNEFGWFLTLFLGSLLSVWNGVFDSLIGSKTPVVFHGICGAGCLLICLSISRITVFRHDRYRALWKLCIMVGMTLCHVMSVADIHEYRMILLGVGIGLMALAYITGRVRSKQHEMDGMKHLLASLNA
jgi:hypothetical protein